MPLFINYFIFEHKPDAWVVYTLTALFFCTFLIVLCRYLAKEKVEPSPASVDNVFTLSVAIAHQIRMCKAPEDFNKAVEAIGRYEWQFMDDHNAKQEAKDLKALLDKKASEVFGVETIFS